MSRVFTSHGAVLTRQWLCRTSGTIAVRCASSALHAEALRAVSAAVRPACLPIIDVSALVELETSATATATSTATATLSTSARRTAEALHAAAIDHGFFYVSNHGVSDALRADVLAAGRAFFETTTEHQRDAEFGLRLAPDSLRGYQRFGDNVTNGKRDLHMAVDYIRAFDTMPDPSSYTPAMKPMVEGVNRMPPTLRAAFEAYRSRVLALGRALMAGFAHALQCPAVADRTRDSYDNARVIFYPPLEAAVADAEALAGTSGKLDGKPSSAPNSVDDNGATWVGQAVHTDYGALTLLLADDGVCGCLQVQAADGTWVAADPVPGCFVVNIGDVLSLWTHGLYQSTPHRVLNNPDGLSRVSVPFFFEPSLTAPIAPMDDLADVPSHNASAAAARLQDLLHRRFLGGVVPPDTTFGSYYHSNISTNFDL